jgi:HTH-type transcriptional regulator/antitoxin HigA
MTINNAAEHEAALARFDQIFDAPENTPEYEEMLHLADLIEDYEDIHYPIGAAEKARAEELKRAARIPAEV